MRKPLMIGLGPVMGPGWVPRMFTRAGALRYMRAEAAKSSLRQVSGCTGLVADCGEYWRGNVAAQVR